MNIELWSLGKIEITGKGQNVKYIQLDQENEGINGLIDYG